MPSEPPRLIDRGELHRALEQQLSLHFRARRRVVRLRRQASRYASSCTIENLGLELDGGQKLQLVLKDLSEAALLPEARNVRPQFLYQPGREIETYRKLLARQAMGTPAFYGAITSAELGRYWLFLERVKGPLLWQLGRIKSWELAAEWLARFHTHFSPADARRNGDSFKHLLRYDEEFFTLWMKQAEAFLRRGQVKAGSETRRAFRRLSSHYDRVVSRLMELPRTLIHGEFYPSNVIVGSTGPEVRICPVDWELAGIAPGLIDLAALTAGRWRQDQKQRMVEAYREALEPAKGWPPSTAELMEGVDYCQLHLSVQLLGWAADWSPPAQHAQDWLREACRLAGRLGL